MNSDAGLMTAPCDARKAAKRQCTYRVWPDGTVQSLDDGSPYSHMSDDYQLIGADSEEEALLKAGIK